MIVKLKQGNRMDGDLKCGQPYCNARGMWQPADRDPCVDNWWCRTCSTWSEPIFCGPYPLMFHQRDALGQSKMVPACA